jgi:hypothetical protein
MSAGSVRKEAIFRRGGGEVWPACRGMYCMRLIRGVIRSAGL